MNDVTGESRVADLSPYECWQLIEASASIARVVWTGQDGPAIAPVNYTVADGAVWFQASPEATLGREAPGQRVLVEIDDVDTAAHTGWSVIVSGVAQPVDAAEVPEILGDLQIWPRGVHTLFVRVEPERITGRRLLSRRA